MRDLRIGIIGAGRLGGAIAVHLARTGWRIAGVCDEVPAKAEEVARIIPTGTARSPGELAQRCEILFFAVQDGQISRLAEALGELEEYKARFLFHFSGILQARVLHLAGMERAVYSLHPFGGIPARSFEDNPFKGLHFGGEGEIAAKPIAEQITKDLGGKFIPIKSSKKAAYHLAASIVANHMFALLNAGENLLENCGLAEKDINSMITELAESALSNYAEHGLLGGLTGPIARGDDVTIAEHLVEAQKHGLYGLYSAGLAELRKLIRRRDKDIID